MQTILLSLYAISYQEDPQSAEISTRHSHAMFEHPIIRFLKQCHYIYDIQQHIRKTTAWSLAGTLPLASSGLYTDGATL